ncbi:hypothetical protein, partial [Pedobacter suwonensis]|uniref:hypothetical protein n=1 Tax=Pedobacter suwonensis TaxID=332999 RepID=UPI003D029DE6
ADRFLYRNTLLIQAFRQKRIEEGNLSALSAFGDVRDLDDDIAKGVIEKLSSATTQRISDLKSGSFAMGVKDFASDLVTLNVWYPQLASWDSISDLLTTELPFVSDRQGVLARIAILGKKIPPEVVDVIAGPLHDLMVALPSEGPSCCGYGRC